MSGEGLRNISFLHLYSLLFVSFFTGINFYVTNFIVLVVIQIFKWVDRITNEDVLEKIREKRTLEECEDEKRL